MTTTFAEKNKAYAHAPAQPRVEHEWKEGMKPIPGQDYLLQEWLGGGGFGEVWRALGPRKFPVALKRVRSKSGLSLPFTDAHYELDALEVMRQIRHANLLAIHCAFLLKDGNLVDEARLANELVVVMELADKSLNKRLEELDGKGIPATELLEYVRDAAKALDYLAKQKLTIGTKTGRYVQHADVKPQNLLIIGDSVVVADFSLVWLMSHTSTVAPAPASLPYADPQILIEGKIDKRSDQFSLAVTFYHLLTGRLPFRRDMVDKPAIAMEQADFTLPILEPYRKALRRALSKNPDDRYANCRDFVANLFPQARSTCRQVVHCEDELDQYVERASRLGDSIDSGFRNAVVSRSKATLHQEAYAWAKGDEFPVKKTAWGIEFLLVPPGTIDGPTFPGVPEDPPSFYVSRSPISDADWTRLAATEAGHSPQPPREVRDVRKWLEAMEKNLSLSMRLPKRAEWQHAARLGLIHEAQPHAQELCEEERMLFAAAYATTPKPYPCEPLASTIRLDVHGQTWRLVLN